MNEELPPLDAELAALLAKAAPVVPPPGFVDQAFGRLDLAPLAASATAAATTASVSTAVKGLAGAKLFVAGAVAVAIGATGGVAVDRLVVGPPAPKVIVKEVRVEVPIEVPVPTPVLTPAPVPAPRPAHANKHVEPAPAPIAAQPAPTAAELDAQLREERAVLEMARTSLGRKDAKGALAQLEEHQHRFPDGRLAEERDAMMVTTLEGLGQHEQARERAKAFLSKYPDSLLAPQVKRVTDR